jgi:hypothetical protein
MAFRTTKQFANNILFVTESLFHLAGFRWGRIFGKVGEHENGLMKFAVLSFGLNLGVLRRG